MRVLLLSEDRVRLEGTAGPMTVEADSPEMAFSPFHMLGASLATCTYSVLYSWAANADLPADDLAIEVGWEFMEDPYRVGAIDMVLDWPGLPEGRRNAAERASHLCTIHQTLQTPPTITTRVAES